MLSRVSVNSMNPYKLTTLIILLILLFSIAGSGQTRTSVLQGIVTDENRAIIPGAVLSLSDGERVIREIKSDDNGEFSFGELPYGRYKVVVSKEGFAVSEREVELTATTGASDMTLAAGTVSEVVTIVLDSAEAALESTLKMPASLHETPRSVSVIGSERIREQNFRQVADVLNFVPGTTQNSYRNGSYHYYSRGYRMGPDDTRLDGFSGINVGSGGFGASMFGVEEVVVLRGPASLVYGQTNAPGGLVNLVTKKPQEKRLTRVDLRGAGYGGNGVSIGERPSFGIDIDTTGSVDKDNWILYRALATAENTNYFTDGTLDRNRYVNGSLTFRLDKFGRYMLTPSVQWTRYNRPYGGGVVISPSSSLRTNDGSDTINTDDLSPLDVNLFGGRRIEETAWGGLDFRGAVTDRFRLNAAYRYIDFDTDINSFTPQVSTAAQITRLQGEHIVSRVQAKSLTERKYHNINADALYEWASTPMFRTTTQAGFYQRIFNSRTTSPLGLIPAAKSPIHIYTGRILSPLTDNFPAIAFGDWGRDVIWNAFVQNRTSLDNGRWNITFGLNYGQQDPASGAVRKSDVMPNAAILFNATPSVALYASYSTSFSPVDPTLEDALGRQGTFGPTTGSNYEAGMKYDLPQRGINLTLAVFQNQIENALVQSDVGVLNVNNLRYFMPAGTRRARGAEATAEYRIREDLNIRGGVSYIEAVYKGFPAGAAVSSAPIPNSWAEKTPRWSYNLYSRYDRREGYLKGLGAGLGVSWQGKRIGSNGARTTANPDPLVLPAFTRVDAALFYRLNRYVNFAMNVDNLFDELIFVNASVGSNIEVAAPRTATFRTTFNF